MSLCVVFFHTLNWQQFSKIACAAHTQTRILAILSGNLWAAYFFDSKNICCVTHVRVCNFFILISSHFTPLYSLHINVGFLHRLIALLGIHQRQQIKIGCIEQSARIFFTRR